MFFDSEIKNEVIALAIAFTLNITGRCLTSCLAHTEFGQINIFTL